MSDDREQQRRQRLADIVDADGAVTLAAELPEGLLTPEGPEGIEVDVAEALSVEIDEEADRLIALAEEDEMTTFSFERRRLIALADPDHPYVPGQPLRTIEDVNSAIAHLLMQPEPEPRPLTAAEEAREQERFEQAQARMKARWATPDTQD